MRLTHPYHLPLYSHYYGRCVLLPTHLQSNSNGCDLDNSECLLKLNVQLSRFGIYYSCIINRRKII